MSKMINRREVLKILHCKLNKGYRDVDGDWVEGTIDKSAINEIEQLPITELPSVQSQSEMSTLISRIRECINSDNRNSCDYYIVDQIENIINEYKGV